MWTDSHSTNNLNHPLTHQRALHLFSKCVCLCLRVCVVASVWNRGRKAAVKARGPLLVLVDRCEGVESEKKTPSIHFCHHHLPLPQHPHTHTHTHFICMWGFSIHDGLVTLEVWGKMFMHQLPKPPWSRLNSAAALGVKGQCSFHVWSVILSTCADV